jgi:proteasome lid subunit RPN8/RPN11
VKNAVRVRRNVVEEMEEAARRGGGLECCGLLAGRDGVITHAFPAPNLLASATQFEIAPVELFRIFRAMHEAGLEHLGIYHSHPRGENAPSARDIERAYYPEAAYFIVSPREDAERPVRAFEIRDARVREWAVEIV